MKEAYKREWNVPSNLAALVAHAEAGYADELEPVDSQESQQAFLDAEAIARRVGGGFTVAAVRAERSDGWVTLGYRFIHKSMIESSLPRHEPQVHEPVATEALPEDAPLEPVAPEPVEA